MTRVRALSACCDSSFVSDWEKLGSFWYLAQNSPCAT